MQKSEDFACIKRKSATLKKYKYKIVSTAVFPNPKTEN